MWFEWNVKTRSWGNAKRCELVRNRLRSLCRGWWCLDERLWCLRGIQPTRPCDRCTWQQVERRGCLLSGTAQRLFAPRNPLGTRALLFLAIPSTLPKYLLSFHSYHLHKQFHFQFSKSSSSSKVQHFSLNQQVFPHPKGRELHKINHNTVFESQLC